MMIAYYVIDDVQSDIDRLVREADKTKELRYAGSYPSVYGALAEFREKKTMVPIIFCDIRFRDENGLDAGPELAKYCKYLVFVTGLSGQQGKVLDAMGDDHLQKPVSCDQIRMRVLDRFFKRHGTELPLRIHLNRLYILSAVDKKYYTERLKDILFVSHSKNYLEIAVKSGRTYTVRSTLDHAFNLLEPAGIFVQINRSTVLNMKCIGKWDGTEVWIADRAFKLLGEGKKNFMAYIKRNKLGNGGAKDQDQ